MTEAVRKLESALYVAARRFGMGTLVRRRGWTQLTTPEARTDFRNSVLRSVLTPRSAERRIDETIAHYARAGVPFRWYVTPSSRPKDLGERLLHRGFARVEILEGMIARTSRFPEPGRDETSVAEIDESDLDDWLAVNARGWSLPPPAVERFRAELLREFGLARRRSHYFLARAAGVPVGVGSLTRIEDFAHLNGAVVLDAYRRRGIYRELILERMRFLRGRGVKLVTNHCLSHTSAPICAKLGFEKACEFRVYRHPGGGT